VKQKKGPYRIKAFSTNVEIKSGNRLRRICQVISPLAAKGL
jgi:hypothetical protein